MKADDRPKAAVAVDAFEDSTLPPHEQHLSRAIEAAEGWVETSPDPSIRAAFRLALHELRGLLPEAMGR
jgi:hypothetical protein